MENKKNIRKKIIIVLLSITIVACMILLYSRYISTSGLIIKEYKIVDEKITSNFHGLKIVHISDIHYGTTIKKKELTNIVNKINTLRPDIVVLTGDLLDNNIEPSENYEKELIEILSQINVSIGKYAISGNHDYAFKNFITIIEQGGFINLDNSYDQIYKNGNNFILLSGISTNMYENNIEEKLASTKDLLNKMSEEEKNNTYKIVLLHEPDFVDNIDTINFDLILAGHSHNGQIRLPFIGAIKTPIYAKKYYDEHYTIKDSELYISSGLGTSKINFRFFNKPSINFYRITNK